MRRIFFLMPLAAGLVFLSGSCKKSSHTPVAMVSTLAGSGTAGFSDGPPGTAQFNHPTNLTCDTHGNIYVADPNNRIRIVTASGLVSTFAGSGITGWADGPGNTAQFNSPYGITCDPQGNLYVSDVYNFCIRKITPEGIVSTFAGTGHAGFADGPGVGAEFTAPYGIASDVHGNLY